MSDDLLQIDKPIKRQRPDQVFGQSPLNGPWLEAYKRLDSAILSFAHRLGASEYVFPSFIQASDLRHMDYLHSFPQHATFPMVLKQEEKNIEHFRKGDLIDKCDHIQLTDMEPAEAILTPAACYHFYIHFQRHNFDQTCLFTTRNNCFRHEVKYISLERQWSFTMREIVCIGSEHEVQDTLETIKTRLSALFENLQMDIVWQVAQDPFFDPLNNPKLLLQKLHPNKHEMVFNNRLAIGSANYHRNYFGETFQIYKNTEYAHSACVAFGIERWLAAFKEHFGDDPDTWPLAIMENI